MASYRTTLFLNEVAYPETLMMIPRELMIGMFAIWITIGGGGMMAADIMLGSYGGHIFLASMLGAFLNWSWFVALYRRNPHFMTVWIARWILSRRLWRRTTNLVRAPGNMYEV